MIYLNYHIKVKEAMLKHADPELAAGQAAYMRDQFQFIGIKTPERRQLSRELMAELGLPESKDLLAVLRLFANDEYRELNYFGLDLTEKVLKKQPESFIDVLEELVLIKSWWDTVDWLAKLVGIHFQRHPQLIYPLTERWMEGGEVWLQRICLIFQLSYKTRTDEALLFGYILHLQESQEFFIQKAAGWALRQYSRTAPDTVRAFLENHPSLPALTRREGGRLLNPR
jgi:3-methyladenine DNA glycosylase AlkD